MRRWMAALALACLIGGCISGDTASVGEVRVKDYPLDKLPPMNVSADSVNPQGLGVAKLKDVEVREYKGERLSSIDDFRENSIKGPQDVDISGYRLEVTGLVENPRSYAYGEVIGRQRYSKVVQLDCVEGWSVNLLWEGVLIRDLLAEAGVKPNANTVILYAVDGYSTSFPLDYLVKNDILLAYKMNNVTIPAERGFPFQLVAENKWGYKWIKWVTKIELSDDPSYRGYWEERGYSNGGDLDKPQFA